MKRLLFLALCLFFIQKNSLTQIPGQDVLRYDFSIWLNDSTDIIQGYARVSMTVDQLKKGLSLNLVNQQGEKGMKVSACKVNGDEVRFLHAQNMLTLTFPKGIAAGDTAQLEVAYAGVPANGLIISTNKHGNRTFLATTGPTEPTIGCRWWTTLQTRPL
jgi:hypothetical protein